MSTLKNAYKALECFLVILQQIRKMFGTTIKKTNKCIEYRCISTLVHCYVFLNLVKPTGHVMHQQFNTQKLYVLPTLYLCVLYLSENKQRLVPLTA
jgi:hypothetical protein